MFKKDPALLVEKAVKGMLPKNKLGAELFRNLNVFVGSEHKQSAQKPKTINLNDLIVMGVIHKIGRRKTAVARVYVSEGTGTITINKREFANYFPTATLQYKVLQPMSMTENVNIIDVKVNVYRRWITGQAEAVRMAISTSYVELNAENRAS